MSGNEFVEGELVKKCYINYSEATSLPDEIFSKVHVKKESFFDRFMEECKILSEDNSIFNVHSREKSDGYYSIKFFIKMFVNIPNCSFEVEGQIFDIKPEDVFETSFKHDIYSFVFKTIEKSLKDI